MRSAASPFSGTRRSWAYGRTACAGGHSRRFSRRWGLVDCRAREGGYCVTPPRGVWMATTRSSASTVRGRGCAAPRDARARAARSRAPQTAARSCIARARRPFGRLRRPTATAKEERMVVARGLACAIPTKRRPERGTRDRRVCSEARNHCGSTRQADRRSGLVSGVTGRVSGDAVLVRPDTVPARPDTVPARPDTVPARPDTVPARPDTVPARPDTVPARPDTVPARPDTVPARLASPPVRPVSPPVRPVSPPARPVSLPARPLKVTSVPRSESFVRTRGNSD